MPKQDKVQVVWFKRDLRVQDHAPLWYAAQQGPTICLYVYEPEIYNAADFDLSHLIFINESLRELQVSIEKLGGRLTIRLGTVPDVFEKLWQETNFETIWCHQETGNALTYQRDLRLLQWARDRHISVQEFAQTGVVRRLANRDGWARKWDQRMNQAIIETPNRLISVSGIHHSRICSPQELGFPAQQKTDVQVGGESHGWQTLESFLCNRGEDYRKAMSSPVTAENSCSRLSTYLAYGNLSIKQVHQATRERMQELKALQKTGKSVDKKWSGSLASFQGRLRWHCHFMQKLEDEPEIEFRNVNRGFDGLRENEFNEEYFQRWCAGETGYPMIDACMKALHATGWINFRMRAMLASFAANHLWLHWRKPAVYLATQFLDYEPGIHYSQFQMQSGVTGINTIRIYSPAKQVRDNDPQGVFLCRYLPCLAHVPDKYLPEPHKMPLSLQKQVGCIIGKDYPEPIVDHGSAYRMARDRIWKARKSPEVQREAERVYQKHGSRKRPRE